MDLTPQKLFAGMLVASAESAFRALQGSEAPLDLLHFAVAAGATGLLFESSIDAADDLADDLKSALKALRLGVLYAAKDSQRSPEIILTASALVCLGLVGADDDDIPPDKRGFVEEFEAAAEAATRSDDPPPLFSLFAALSEAEVHTAVQFLAHGAHHLLRREDRERAAKAMRPALLALVDVAVKGHWHGAVDWDNPEDVAEASAGRDYVRSFNEASKRNYAQALDSQKLMGEWARQLDLRPGHPVIDDLDMLYHCEMKPPRLLTYEPFVEDDDATPEGRSAGEE